MQMVTIRSIREEDIPALLVMGKFMVEEGSFAPLTFSENKVEATLRACVQLAGHLCLVAKVDGEVIGVFIAGVTSPWFSEKLIAKDKALYVVPRYRGAGVAQNLVKEYLMWAEEYGVEVAMVADSSGVNIAGVKHLYENEGFEVVGHVFRKRIK